MRWILVPALRDLDATMEEIHWGKEHGAVGVLFRGVEKDRSLAEPYFFPVYEEAQKLDLPICIHTGPGSPILTEMFDSRLSFVFPDVRLLPVMAFYDLAANKIPEKFPDLRWGFIEANSSWVPFLAHFLNRRFKTGRAAWGPEFFRDNRLFVACEADEDLPYILQYTGEDNMITGSDYGHGDQSAEPELIQLLRGREDVSRETMDKILCENPARLYGV
jgi:predicted TIM-barrel fold metal-dependent hydrolase